MSFRLGKYNGIPIKIHWSFTLLFIGIVTAISITSTINDGILYGIGIIALFASVLIHEFMHSYMADRFGYPTEEIVLYPLGGMSKIEDLPTNAKQEFMIAFMGPVTNFVIGGIVLVFSILLPLDFAFLGRNLLALVQYYAFLNFGLGAFNLFVPAIPMDGGRLLRSLLSLRMSYPKATQLAVQVSQVLALIMALVGLIINPWLIFIAIFVYVASNGELQESLTKYILDDIPTTDVMNTNIDRVKGDLTVTDLLDKMLDTGNIGFLVENNKETPIGIVTLSDIREVPPDKRQDVTIEDIVSSQLVTVPTTSTAQDALAVMKKHEIGRIYVTDGTNIVGQITRNEVIKFVQIKGVEKEMRENTKKLQQNVQQPTPS